MKILVLTQEKMNGVLFYRSVLPHAYMARQTEHEMHFTDLLMQIPDEDLEKFDIVHMVYFMVDTMDVKRCQRLGVKVVIDVDDYWYVDRMHELYDHFIETKRDELVRETCRMADAVTTTTELLASKIRQYNSKVSVIANVLMDDNFIKPHTNPIPYLAWVGGNNHTADMFIIQHLMQGYKFPVFIPEMYRQVFRDRFLYYAAQKIPNYLGLYNQFDIFLIPLRNVEFNKYKSPLKLMEAGMFSKPIIVSDVEPFSQHLKHKENCLVVKKPSQWAKWAKVLSNDAEMRRELGEGLRKYVNENFSMEEATKKREAFYASLLP